MNPITRLNYSKYLRVIFATLFFWGLFLFQIDPLAAVSGSRNAVRQTDVNQIMDALTKYHADNPFATKEIEDSLPKCEEEPLYIGHGEGNFDLYESLTGIYLTSLPYDPKTGDLDNTRYSICITSYNRIKISAPDAEDDRLIGVIR